LHSGLPPLVRPMTYSNARHRRSKRNHAFQQDNTDHGFSLRYLRCPLALADQAFAAACNFDYAPSMAVHVDASFFAPAKAGDVLRAEATEVRRGRTMGFYEMLVTNQDGKPIAKVTGVSYSRG